MIKIEKNCGITLISLVVTIVVLLILTGTTISMLTGDNGLLNKATLAKKLTEVSNEKEAIELVIVLAKIDNELNNLNKYYIGIPLYDRTFENGTKWNIITINESQKQYGTGWNYIEKNTEIIDYGKAKNNWLVNYSTGEIIQLEEKQYTQLSYASSLAITENLIFNADPTNMENSTSWGNGITLHGFDNEESGYTKDSLKFDGIDDYITIDYGKNNSIEKGFTLEFYGKITGDGISYNNNNEIVKYAYNGLFCLWNGQEDKQARLRFGYNRSSR